MLCRSKCARAANERQGHTRIHIHGHGHVPARSGKDKPTLRCRADHVVHAASCGASGRRASAALPNVTRGVSGGAASAAATHAAAAAWRNGAARAPQRAPPGGDAVAEALRQVRVGPSIATAAATEPSALEVATKGRGRSYAATSNRRRARPSCDGLAEGANDAGSRDAASGGAAYIITHGEPARPALQKPRPIQAGGSPTVSRECHGAGAVHREPTRRKRRGRGRGARARAARRRRRSSLAHGLGAPTDRRQRRWCRRQQRAIRADGGTRIAL